MGLFKMGVCPKMGVLNPNSHYPPVLRLTLSADEAIGQTTLSYNVATAAYPHPYTLVRAGDHLLIGPSTDETYKGYREQKIVSSVSLTEITISSALEFSYDSGDPITIVGTNLPVGWVPSTNEASHIFPLGMTPTTPAAYGSSLIFPEKNRLACAFYSAAGDILELVQNLGDLLFSTVVYRFGFWGTDTPSHADAPDIKIVVDDGDTETVLDVTSVFGEHFTTKTVSNPSKLEYIIRAQAGVGTTEYAVFYGGYFYICHAKETDDEANGVYTFDDYPDLASFSINEITTTGQSRLIDESSVFYDSLGLSQRRPKFNISCQFTHVSNNFYQQLRILKAWQDQGNWICFFHNTDDFDDQGIPPMLVGTFELSGVNKGLWNLGKVSFNFSFTEEA